MKYQVSNGKCPVTSVKCQMLNAYVDPWDSLNNLGYVSTYSRNSAGWTINKNISQNDCKIIFQDVTPYHLWQTMETQMLDNLDRYESVRYRELAKSRKIFNHRCSRAAKCSLSCCMMPISHQT